MVLPVGHEVAVPLKLNLLIRRAATNEGSTYAVTTFNLFGFSDCKESLPPASGCGSSANRRSYRRTSAGTLSASAERL
jgi:hypothetical protein